MGETVLKKSQYDQDVATARAFNRTELAELAATQAAQQQKALSPQTAPQPQPTIPMPALLQTILPVVLRPLQLMTSMLATLPQQLGQAMAQAAQNLATRTERVVSQLLSFFFGYKKDKTEEKEQRDRNDDSLPDIFGDNTANPGKIQQKDGAGLTGGGK